MVKIDNAETRHAAVPGGWRTSTRLEAQPRLVFSFGEVGLDRPAEEVGRKGVYDVMKPRGSFKVILFQSKPTADVPASEILEEKEELLRERLGGRVDLRLIGPVT